MSQNKITFTISLDANVDPEKVGLAIATLIKTLTPSEEWEAVAEGLKTQVGKQLAAMTVKAAQKNKING